MFRYRPVASLPSIRSKMARLVLACVLPTVIGFALLAYDSYTRERNAMLQDASRLADSMLLAVERDLAAGESAGRALASSPSLAAGQLRDFHRQASSLASARFPVFAFVLSDREGNPILSTRVPYGSPLPPNGNAAHIRAVVQSGVAATSDLYPGDSSQPYLVSVDVPVYDGGMVAYVLSAQLLPERLSKVLRDHNLPQRWTAQLFDGNARFIARNVNMNKVLGTPSSPAVAAAVRTSGRGMVELMSRDGYPVLSVFARSSGRPWFIAVGIPTDRMVAIVSNSLTTLLVSVALLLACGIAAAWRLADSIRRSLLALRAPAVALGGDTPLELPVVAIRETAEVALSLQQADADLRRYRTGLEQLVEARTAELQRSTALLENLYTHAPVGLALLDRDLKIVMINSYVAQLGGITREQAIGRSLPELLGPAGEQLEIPFRKVRDTGQALAPAEMTAPVLRNPSMERQWLVSYQPVLAADGSLVGVSGMVLDVSEKNVLMQRLRDVSAQFHALYELSGDAHLLLGTDGQFKGGNASAAKLFGTSVAELERLTPQDWAPELQPDGEPSSERFDACVRQALERGSHHFEFVFKRHAGRSFHADVLLTRLHVAGRGVLQATVRDISVRILSEKALRATTDRLQHSERFVRTVADNLPVQVGYWDANLICRFANRAYQAWQGRDVGVTGLHQRELLGPTEFAAQQPVLERVLAGETCEFPRTQPGPGGDPRETWVNYIPDLDNGKVRGFYVLITDQTEARRSERRLQALNDQLVQALDKAEQASRAKSEFLANMSHEIRTPMNAIMGLARLLEEAQLAPRERNYVAKMTRSTRSLLGLLNDVLDFSRIEAGQLPLERTTFELDDTLGSISVLTADTVARKGVELVYDVAAEVPMRLVGDPMRLEQVLLNLVGNALKFTEHGEVALRVRRLPDQDGRIRLHFSVRDTGPGIAPEHQARLFEAFSQGDSSTSRKFGGAGLGLAICRRLVALMGGTLGVTSAPGAGADFHFDCGFDPAAQPPHDSAPAGPPVRVLLADDRASVRAAMVQLAPALGWQLDLAESGTEALDLLRAAQRSHHPYEFWVLDSAMPGLDGLSALTYARADQSMQAPPCILMVAEHTREQMAAMQDELGIDALLSKPVTLSAIKAVLVGLREPDESALLPSSPRLSGRLQGVRVLLVEDNEINQEVANFILLHASATVDIAVNGQEAVTLLSERPHHYDVVLMDIQMPVMNGYQAAQAIRAMGLAELPIIAMTANAMADDRIQAMAAGMNGHVAKPIEVDRLMAEINRLTVDGEERERRHAGIVSAAAPDEPGASGQPVTIPGIDLRSALPRFGGNMDSLVTLLKRFAESQSQAVQEIRTAFTDGDRQLAGRLSHRLRGVAANLGAQQVAAAAFEVEQALRSGGGPDVLLRLSVLDTTLGEVFESAAQLAEPAHPGSDTPATLAHDPGWRNHLEELLTLLHNNNLKAMGAFDRLRPALLNAAGTGTTGRLAAAIATLKFAEAAAVAEEILNRKDAE